MGTNSQNESMHVGVNDSEVGQLNVAERIVQHYHVEAVAPAAPSLSALQLAYSTSEETLRQARLWSAVCALPWMGLTAFLWAVLPHQLPPNSGPFDLLVYVMVFAFIPFATRVCMPDQLKAKRDQWRHVIKAEVGSMADLHHQIVREKARLRVLLSR